MGPPGVLHLDDTYRALDTAQRLLEAVSAEQAADVARSKQDVLRSVSRNKAKRSAARHV